MSRLNDSEPKGNLDMSSQRSSINQGGWRERVVNIKKKDLRKKDLRFYRKRLALSTYSDFEN